MTAPAPAYPRLLVSDQRFSLASPASLSAQVRAGQEPHAELRVEYPHGKTSRVVTARLSEPELLRLAEAALEAARELRAFEARRRAVT